MNPYWIVIGFSACVQFFFFLRWLHRRTRDDEIRRAFVRDMAINHLPHLYHALRQIAGIRDGNLRSGWMRIVGSITTCDRTKH